MNREKLKQLMDALQAAIAELAPELEKPVDPFVVHIYFARRNFDRECGRKSGKRAEQYASMSYVQAWQYGFRGNEKAWWDILTANTRSATGE
jgi:hypothetical protein